MFSRPPATPSADPSENWDDNPGIADRFKSSMNADLSYFSACPTVAEPPNGQVKKHIRFRNRTCPQRKIFFGYLPQMRSETPFDPTRTSTRLNQPLIRGPCGRSSCTQVAFLTAGPEQKRGSLLLNATRSRILTHFCSEQACQTVQRGYKQFPSSAE